MEIFNNNQRLETLAIYALDWGMYLRRDLDGPFNPFILLQHGEKMYKRVLMGEGDPVAFALENLKKEEKPFQQFAIGIEGYLRDQEGNRTDAVIIQAYDVTQPTGVALAIPFLPKEQGGFRKLDKINHMGAPELPIPLQENPNANYKLPEEPVISGVSLSQGDLTGMRILITHDNPSLINTEVRATMRNYLQGDKATDFSGDLGYALNFSGSATDFLKFLVLQTLQEEEQSDYVKQWEVQTGRKLTVSLECGDEKWYPESAETRDEEKATPKESAETEKKEEYDFSGLSNDELDVEFVKIISIPNARTNITALRKMSELMKEYEKRGLKMPSDRGENSPNVENQTNSGGNSSSRVFVWLIALVVVYLLIRWLF